MLTMAELRDRMNTLGTQIRDAATQLSAMALDENADMAEIERRQNALRDMNSRMSAMRAAYDAQYHDESAEVPGADTGAATGNRSLRDMLRSREYARAFAYAVRNGINPSRGGGDERCRVLFDALTESGGGGEDGGFLVPEDIDHTIRELRRTLDPLAELFTTEPTATNKGWRVQDKEPTKGMTKLDSEIPEDGVAMDDQPQFVKVPFTLDTYGLILPVSNELASDEVAGLFSYLARWFAKKQIITENQLLKALLEKLTAANITTTDSLDQIKRVLNVTLDPAISLNAALLTNQDGFDYLDNLKDTTGRPMLQPDPTNATAMLFKGRRVKMVANSLLPTREVTATGATKGTYYPLYIGDFQQFGTLFVREGLEVKSTDVGGNAFRSNSIEVRGITRLGASTFDANAVARREIFIPAT